jgi:hypothetical protein
MRRGICEHVKIISELDARCGPITDSPAEEWYTDQDTPVTKPTWENFETAFKACFPGVQKAKKSLADLERELANLRLDKKTLVATVVYRGQDAWSHVVFTEKALDLAKHMVILPHHR